MQKSQHDPQQEQSSMFNLLMGDELDELDELVKGQSVFFEEGRLYIIYYNLTCHCMLLES